MLANRYHWLYKDDFTAYLSQEELANFESKSAKKGEIIYANKVKMIFLKQGLAHVNFHNSKNPDSNEFLSGFLEPNTCLLLDSHSSLVCVQDCKYLQINLKKVQNLLTNQLFSKSLFNALVRDVLSVHEMVRDSIFLNSSQKLEKFIYAKSIVNENGERIVHLPFSVSDIEKLIGVSRHHLSSEFNAMRKAGTLIKLENNKYLIK